VKSYPLHKHTRKINGEKCIKNSAENNQNSLYALRYEKEDWYIKDIKSVVTGGPQIANIGTYRLWSYRIVR